MNNYSVICESNRIRFEGTLKDCFNEIKNAAPFRIINNTTGLTVLVRRMSGFYPAKRFYSAYPAKAEKLENSRKFYLLF